MNTKQSQKDKTQYYSVSFVHQRILDFAVLMILLLVGWTYTFGTEYILDIGLYDESAYLHGGLLIPQVWPSAQNSPLYSLWYYFLSLIQPDSIQLYFLNYKLMVVLPPLALFITLRSLQISRVFSLLLCCGFLFSIGNFLTWPKISNFAVLILLLGFYLLCLARSPIIQTSILTITVLLTSYIRPEYFLAFMGLSIFWFILLVLQLKYTPSPKFIRPIKALLLVFLPCIILFLWLGIPMGSGNRSFIAFGQHYANNWVQWNNSQQNPATDWEVILTQDFGDSTSIVQAFFANPLAFIHHIFQNLQGIFVAVKSIFASTFPYSITAHNALRIGVFILLCSGLACFRHRDLVALWQRVGQNWTALKFRSILLLFTLIPVGISIVLISPRHHYIYILGTLSIVGISMLLLRDSEVNSKKLSYWTTVLICIIILAITRPISTTFSGFPQSNLSVIKSLRDLNLSIAVDILEAEGGYGIYVGEHYNRIAEYDKNTPFLEFMQQQSIDIIVMSPNLDQDRRFRNDPEWHAFKKDPALFGFLAIAIPNVEDRSLLVTREILAQRS